MTPFKLGKTKTKPRIEDDEDEIIQKPKRQAVSAAVDVRYNRDISKGKIHVETLYAIFDNYRALMSQASYGASNNPFLLERRIHQLRVKLRQDLTEMGFGDILDFGFIPMPDPIRVGEKVAKDLNAKKGKRKSRDEDEDEDA